MNRSRLAEPPHPPKSFAEFFAGIGLVHEGLRRSGWACTYANDIDPKKRLMYEGHFGSAPYYRLGDVWETERVVGDISGSPFLATASFPCIDLSLAGHWKGIDGEHSSAYFGFLAAIGQLGDRRPRMVLLENVNGFLTSNDGDDFRRAARELASLGYWIDAIVLDAKRFVPQSRPRTFVFGFHEGLDSSLLVRRSPSLGMFDPWQQAIEFSRELRPPALLKAFEGMDLPTGLATTHMTAPRATRCRLDAVLDADDEQDWWSEGETTKHYESMEVPSRGRVDELLRAGGTAIGTAFRRTRRGKTRTEVRFDIAGCLRTPKGGSARQIVIAIGGGKLRMRWMSAAEYGRLQGAGDFRITVPPIQAMYGFGDAVCVPAISWIDRAVLTPVFESSRRALATA